jgi:hypothetical protein
MCLSAILAALASASCRVESRSATPRATGDETLDHGVFQPMSIRIHPLTREVRTDTQSDVAQTIIIDVHLELFDAWGHPTKALGTIQFELIQGSRTGLQSTSALDENVYRATIDMTNPQENSTQYYDNATRTYRLYLEAPRRITNAPITLNTTFVTPSGRQLEDRYIIDRRSGPPRPQPEATPTDSSPQSDQQSQ